MAWIFDSSLQRRAHEKFKDFVKTSPLDMRDVHRLKTIFMGECIGVDSVLENDPSSSTNKSIIAKESKNENIKVCTKLIPSKISIISSICNVRKWICIQNECSLFGCFSMYMVNSFIVSGKYNFETDKDVRTDTRKRSLNDTNCKITRDLINQYNRTLTSTLDDDAWTVVMPQQLFADFQRMLIQRKYMVQLDVNDGKYPSLESAENSDTPSEGINFIPDDDKVSVKEVEFSVVGDYDQTASSSHQNLPSNSSKSKHRKMKEKRNARIVKSCDTFINEFSIIASIKTTSSEEGYNKKESSSRKNTSSSFEKDEKLTTDGGIVVNNDEYSNGNIYLSRQDTFFCKKDNFTNYQTDIVWFHDDNAVPDITCLKRMYAILTNYTMSDKNKFDTLHRIIIVSKNKPSLRNMQNLMSINLNIYGTEFKDKSITRRVVVHHLPQEYITSDFYSSIVLNQLVVLKKFSCSHKMVVPGYRAMSKKRRENISQIEQKKKDAQFNVNVSSENVLNTDTPNVILHSEIIANAENFDYCHLSHCVCNDIESENDNDSFHLDVFKELSMLCDMYGLNLNWIDSKKCLVSCSVFPQVTSSEQKQIEKNQREIHSMDHSYQHNQPTNNDYIDIDNSNDDRIKNTKKNTFTRMESPVDQTSIDFFTVNDCMFSEENCLLCKLNFIRCVGHYITNDSPLNTFPLVLDNDAVVTFSGASIGDVIAYVKNGKRCFRYCVPYSENTASINSNATSIPTLSAENVQS